MRKILLAGGTGLIGSRLSVLLREKGYEVRLLTRHPQTPDQYPWDPSRRSMDKNALEDVFGVINLSGAGIASKRWTEQRKKEIIDSRVQTAHLLRHAFSETEKMPEVYLSASAIGYYGNSADRLMTETDPPADQSFLSLCCQAWEESAEEMEAMGIRTAVFRIGIVLSAKGGALPEFVKPIRFGIHPCFSGGRAWYSWIHIDDLCNIFIRALENHLVEGIYNAVAPNPVRNRVLGAAISKAMNRWALPVRIPAFALRLALGEMSATVLNSNFVSSEKIQAAGFRFKYPVIGDALSAIFNA